ISRNHLLIYFKNDQLFAQDLGSTNGSFVNASKMLRGKDYAFSNVVPITLGRNVQIVLLDGGQVEEEAGADLSGFVDDSTDYSEGGMTTTRQIKPMRGGGDDVGVKSPNMDLINQTISDAEKLIPDIEYEDVYENAKDQTEADSAKNGNKRRPVNPKKKSKEKQPAVSVRSLITLFVVCFSCASVLFYTFVYEEPFIPVEANDVDPIYDAEEIRKKIKEKEDLKRKAELNLTPEKLLEEKNEAIGFLQGDRCITDWDKKFCDIFNQGVVKPRGFNEGVTVMGNKVYVIADVRAQLDMFTKEFRYSDQEKKDLSKYVKGAYSRDKYNIWEFKKTLIFKKLNNLLKARLLAFYELYRQDYTSLMESSGFLDEIMVIIYIEKEGRFEYLGHIQYKLKYLRELDRDKLILPLKYAGLSGVTNEISKTIKYFERDFPKPIKPAPEPESKKSPLEDLKNINKQKEKSRIKDANLDNNAL
ncbi:FHA domain-containing protein, partial [Bacteriovoracaceae bacterium]|nr:FHA domain-containing protein [Bacteriovoracaceae bacterium]